MRQLKISRQITRRDENSVNLYLQEVNKYPMVTVEEEVALSERIRKGDDKALKKLVESNLRFVISVAKQYQNQGLSFPDLINEGNLGLVKAASRFDETKGFKFISYAVWWIRQSIMQAISEQTRIVRLPLNRLTSIKKISRAMNYLEQKFEREPTNTELAEYLEMNVDLVNTNNSIKQHSLSLDKPLSHDGDSDFSLYDLVETENTITPDGHLLADSVRIDLLRALKKLDRREAEILKLSFGIDTEKVLSLHEIGSFLEISSERVRQLKTAGLHKLKNMLSGKTAFHDNI
jgi:RNA polymerase primary sigma factor